MNKKELFDGFWDECVLNRRRIDTTPRHEDTWKECIRCSQWLVECRLGSDQVRIRNLVMQQVSVWEETELYFAIRKYLKHKIGTTDIIQNKIGLVLAGGGARGAYQIGVWKALKAVGVDSYIGGISGTSIGAVNTLLFALGDYEAAEKIWKQVSSSDFRRVNRNRIEEFTRAYSKQGVKNPIYEILEKEFISQPELQSLIRQTIAGKAKEINEKYHLFSSLTPIEESEKLLQNVLFDAKRKVSSVDGVHYVSWKLLSAMEIASAVLASTAVPFIYDPVDFKGKKYYDGGLFDNTPVYPLYQSGYRNLLVVHLNKKQEFCTQIDQAYPDCNIVHFVPGNGFRDDFFSMLDLSPESTQMRISKGFREGLINLDKNTPKLRKMMGGAGNGSKT